MIKMYVIRFINSDYQPPDFSWNTREEAEKYAKELNPEIKWVVEQQSKGINEIQKKTGSN